MQPNIKFSKKDPERFYPTLRKRVNQYFEEQNIKKTGNFKLYFKTLIMFAIYLVPMVMVYTQALSISTVFVCYALMGVGMSGIGFSVMHDANHGSYSNRPWVNKLVSYSMEFIGASSFTWKIQHNILHHSYTNIYNMDEDIHDKPFLRLSPHGKLKGHHRFQHLYAPLLYSLATISWTIQKDFKQTRLYHSTGITEKFGFNKTKETIILIFGKLLYIGYTIVLPIMLGLPVWLVLTGFLFMHMVSGLLITLVFQLAHVVEGPEHFDLPEDGNMENIWMVHQLKTTANFACNNPLVTWFTGGLNHQIEHHLFPTISHIHYPNISTIVKTTAAEHGVPYVENKYFFNAIGSHFHTLKLLGNDPSYDLREA